MDVDEVGVSLWEDVNLDNGYSPYSAEILSFEVNVERGWGGGEVTEFWDY